MKKNIVLLSMMILTTIMLQAQTKEQTISWLKEKLTKYFQNDAKSIESCRRTYSLKRVDINECEIVFKCKYYWCFSNGTTDEYDISMPIQGLRLTENNDFSLPYQGIKCTQTSTTNKEIKLSKPYNIQNTQDLFKINGSGEIDLIERIQKAINRLAESCSTKKKKSI